MPSTSALATRTTAMRMRTLGRIAEDLDRGSASRATDALVFARPVAQRTEAVLPNAVAIRRVDASGRLNPGFEDHLDSLLGWCAGALEVISDGGWLLLRQPASFVGAARCRDSHLAHLTMEGGKTERVCLSNGHRRLLGLGESGPLRDVLVAVVASASALVITRAELALSGPPPRITGLITPA